MIPCLDKFELKSYISYMSYLLGTIENDDEKQTYVDRLISVRAPILLDKCYVKNSSIHGKGVFAKEYINEGDIITLYPGDYLVYYPIANGRNIKGHYKRITSQEIDLDREVITRRYKRLCRYLFDIDEHYSIIGEPKNCEDAAYLGHMINDGVKCSKQEHIPIYIQLSLQMSNVEFKLLNNVIIGVVALRNIQPDEELFVSYGIGYWSKNH